MWIMKRCSSCQYQLPEISRFCTQCGKPLSPSSDSRSPMQALGLKSEDLNIHVLYAMVGVLILALVFPPWETPPSRTPEFLGLHFILQPPQPDAMVSRLLLTIELTTIAIAGLYLSFLFRRTVGAISVKRHLSIVMNSSADNWQIPIHDHQINDYD